MRAVATKLEDVLQWGRVRSNAETNKHLFPLKDAHLLQWGRVRSNAETLSIREVADLIQEASMGPRSVERGNYGHGGAMQEQTVLQWGRVRSNAETQRLRVAAQLLRDASMGPRSVERGNPPLVGGKFSRCSRHGLRAVALRGVVMLTEVAHPYS